MAKTKIIPKKKKKNIIREYAEALAIAIIGALILRAFVIQAFRIPTGSMEDTLLVGDFLLVNKFWYGAKVPFTDYRLPSFADPKQGDVIVFKYPLDPSLDYIKRCIAVEGQTLLIKDKQIYVDGKPFTNPDHVKFIDPHIKKKGVVERQITSAFPEGSFNRDNFGPVVIPKGYLFMMGDNRDNSLDSRYWGFMPKENVVGKALIIYWSWNKDIPLYRILTKIRWGRILDLIN